MPGRPAKGVFFNEFHENARTWVSPCRILALVWPWGVFNLLLVVLVPTLLKVVAFLCSQMG